MAHRVIGGIVLLLVAGSIVWIIKVSHHDPALDLDTYDYRATRQLVSDTFRAAELVKREGEKAWEKFRRDPESWISGPNSYFYVYQLDGRNLYHGGYPHFVGQNLLDYRDILGKRPVVMIIDQLKNHQASNPHGWVHYLWVPPGALDPVWKASCNFKVTMPDGREVFVGSGMDSALPEREFFRVIVDEAAQLLEKEGKKAIPILQDMKGFFTIRDKGLFVLDQKGNTLLDPGRHWSERRNLFEYQDLSGSYPLKELNKKLAQVDSAWVIILKHDADGNKAIKKGIYGRRIDLEGESAVVGVICELPEPAWMR